jgi:tumor protein p53-inducible protein 3
MDMKAVVVNQPGGIDQLQISTRPQPECARHELLVRVKATSVNRADIMQRQGKYLPPLGASSILGLDMAGVVEKVGEDCTAQWKPGDRVFGLLAGGGYAEYTTIPGAMATPIPDSLSFTEAAAIPEVFLTAYQTLFWIGKLERGEKVLIHAGASGVGTAAIQLAQTVGATPIVTVGSEEKQALCLQLGAHFAFNYLEGPFDTQVRNCTHGSGVHLILDFVGAPYFEQNLDVLQVDGRLVLISTLGGSRCNKLSLMKILSKRIQITGTTLRSRTDEYKTQLSKEFASFALPLFQEKRLHPVIDRVFPWTEVRAAHQYMEENKNRGKIVLKLED